jgi:acetyl-CoA carboxylase biotin carboxyl carrier protein
MDLDEIKQILELMRENDLAEFELEQDGVKVRLRKQGAQPASGGVVMAPAVSAPASPASAGSERGAEAEAEDVDLAIVKSPIVGTFYRAAEPGARPFADVGQTVKQGQVMCIIEAMKLMNEITADCDGEVVKVYVENGQAVHYGERLFAIRPA